MSENINETNKVQDENRQGNNTFKRVYDDTTYFIDSIISEYSVFPDILSMMRDGNATIELKKRYLLRAIDETWVNIIEDTLPALDTIIRNPSKFIEEREEVMPIELSRNISVRSLQHLSQHTNLISKIEGDKITPSKILNVFREETLQTYENKFINTLINRLFVFVNRRYEIAKQSGQDEKTTALDFNEDFDHDKVKVKMHFHMEIAESATDEEDKVERNYTYTTDLWHRVERLNKIVTGYLNSEFVANMGQSYIRPPVMRTNAILKNKNLRQCLALWQFIEGYDNAGYSMLVQEDLENVDDAYVKELYSTLAVQYLIFRYNIKNEFDADKTLVSEITDNELKPKIISELKTATGDEFDLVDIKERVPEMPSMTRYGTLTPEDKIFLSSIDIALDAADKIKETETEDIYSSGAIDEPEANPEHEEEEAAENEEEPTDSDLDTKPQDETVPKTPLKVSVKPAEIISKPKIIAKIAENTPREKLEKPLKVKPGPVENIKPNNGLKVRVSSSRRSENSEE